VARREKRVLLAEGVLGFDLVGEGMEGICGVIYMVRRAWTSISKALISELQDISLVVGV
jgi:hypothetical protein